MNCTENKKKQAVARMADRIASQHLCGSRDHLTPRISFPINWWSFGTKPLSLNCFRDTQRRM